MSTGGDDAFSRPVCVFTVEVSLDNVPAYTATYRQSVPITVPEGVVIDFKAALEEFTK